MPRLGTTEAMDLLRDIALVRGVPVSMIVGPSRLKRVTAARRQFCMQAVALGIGTQVVAAILGCDHSTVSYHASPQMQEQKRMRHIERRLAQAAPDA